MAYIVCLSAFWILIPTTSQAYRWILIDVQNQPVLNAIYSYEKVNNKQTKRYKVIT